MVKTVKAYWCPTNGNYGDIFTEYLFKTVFGIQLINNGPKEARLISCGSIMAAVTSEWSGHILGTGILYGDSKYDLSRCTVHGLRGHLTLDRCKIHSEAPEPVLGDIGLLSFLFAPVKIQKKYLLGIIPHEVDKNIPELDRWRSHPHVDIIDINAGVREVVARVSACRTIVSSALHGLVIADSLGIPNHWVRLSDRLHGGDFKFRDYYSVFGLPALCDDEISLISEQNWIRPNIEMIKNNLMKTALQVAEVL